MQRTGESRWLRCYQRRPQASLRLFCIPYAGAGASIFRPWGALLPDTVELWAVQLPGREDRLSEVPFTELPAVVERLVSELLPLLDRPFALFGHSLGALLAYEIGRALAQGRGPSPVHLFVSGRRAPQVPRLGPPRSDLTDEGLVDELRRLGGTPERLLQEEALMRLMLPVLRADFALLDRYVPPPTPPLPVPLTVYFGDADPEAAEHAMEPWREHTADRFTMRRISGGHFFIKESLGEVLAHLLQQLQRAA